MKLKLLERLRRSRNKHKLEYLEQTPERKETERIRDKFEDEVVEGRSPSMSRLKRWETLNKRFTGAVLLAS